jgi:hypothetical protein
MSDRCVRCMLEEHDRCDGYKYGPHPDGPWSVKEGPCICKSKAHPKTNKEDLKGTP